MYMKKQIALIFCLVFLIGIVSATDINKVGDWWGTVTINGAYADGEDVSAYINNVKVARATVGAIQPNYYLIHVEGNEGDDVIFKVNGKEATTQSWSKGDHELDLEVVIDTNTNEETTSTPSSPSPSSGSPSSSPSSSSYPTTTQTPNDDGTINLKFETQEDEIVDLPSDETQGTIKPGITGSAIGFAKTGKGIGLIFAFLIIVFGIGVIAIKFKPLKKWTKKSSG